MRVRPQHTYLPYGYYNRVRAIPKRGLDSSCKLREGGREEIPDVYVEEVWRMVPPVELGKKMA